MSKVKDESDERRGVEESKNVLGVLLELSRLVLSLQGSKGRGNPKISKLGSSQSLSTQLYTTEKS